MNPVVLGLIIAVAWFAVSIPAGLLIGRWLRNASQAREQADYPVSNVSVIGRRPLTLDQIPSGLGDLLPRQERSDEGEPK